MPSAMTGKRVCLLLLLVFSNRHCVKEKGLFKGGLGICLLTLKKTSRPMGLGQQWRVNYP